MFNAVLTGPSGPEYLAPAWVKDPSLLTGAEPIELAPGASAWPTTLTALLVLLVLLAMSATAVLLARRSRARSRAAEAGISANSAAPQQSFS